MEQAPVSHPPLTDGDIRAELIKLAQAATVQAQPMTAQANLEVVPHPHQQVSTMAYLLRDFTRMNSSTFFGSKFEKTPKNSPMRSIRYF